MKRTWFAIAALVVVSLLGDLLCRSLASSVDAKKLMQAAGERLNQLPARFGNWRMTKSEPLDENAIRMLQCHTHESRVYVDDQTGETVSVVLMVGPAGPLVAHTPEVCYGSVDFEMVEAAHPETIRGTGVDVDVFNQVMFRTRKVTAARQRVFYGWRKSQGAWLAPKNPRLALGGQPMLYKMQIAAEAPGELQPEHPLPDPARRFLTEFLPALGTTLNKL
jgi:hypothetical protein